MCPRRLDRTFLQNCAHLVIENQTGESHVTTLPQPDITEMIMDTNLMETNSLHDELQELDFENFEIEDIAEVGLHAPALSISLCSSSSSCSSTSSSCSSGCSSS